MKIQVDYMIIKKLIQDILVIIASLIYSLPYKTQTFLRFIVF